ncbi:type II secretion system protein [Glaciihabitans arcticus]|uniref:Type II secretion system protein n=1 Tax=Glaciihabitans arcticus TaxID=2668039 RepID=A0A4Q9GW71_9MICO|nr:type II secretion system protein [Glaciihabitans arcticus]TBN57848.1 type II secretion system protein [Glaciihabitans arcticus]
MKRLRERLLAEDAGFSLAEVVVAMMIFALVSTGTLYTMMAMMELTRDTRVRQVAVNLAAEEIDRAREVDKVADLVSWNTDPAVVGGLSLDDPNDPKDRKGVITINGDKFHVKRTVQWVSDPASSLQCGASASGTSLRYKRVNVEVRWDGMRSPENPVQADTVINPRQRVNDPAKGSLLISVLDANGNGVSGITPVVSPASGVVAQPTDIEGCSYLINVTPNTYSITLSKAGYLDETQNASPSATGVIVDAGFTNSRKFQFDQSGKYTLTFPAARPATFMASFMTAERTFVQNLPASGEMPMFPVAYRIVAGDVTKCPAADPARWSTGTDGLLPPVNLVPNEPAPYVVSPGGSITVPVEAGQLRVPSLPNNGAIRAVSSTFVGVPACTTAMTLNFPVNQKTISLPYGNWKLSNVGSGTSAILPTAIQLVSYGRINLDGSVTLDPRTVG